MLGVIAETVVQGFNPDPRRGEGIHNDAPKRVTTPAGIIAIGIGALRLSSGKTFASHRVKLPKHDLGAENIETPQAPGCPATRFSPTDKVITTTMLLDTKSPA